MSNTTKPQMLNDTGVRIATALEGIAAGLGSQGRIFVSSENRSNATKPRMLNETGVRIIAALEEIAATMGFGGERVTSLTDLDLASGIIIEAVGTPIYLDENDLVQYDSYGLTETGWYVFARITAKAGTSAAGASVEGAAGYIIGEAYIDVAVRFEVAAVSQMVVVDWGEITESFVFKATDLAVRNLDYRVTFYVYDIEDYITWEYALTTDATFAAGKAYFIKEGDEYTPAEVTAGDTVPAVYYEDLYTLTEDETFVDGKTYYTESDGVYTAAEVTTGEDVTAGTYYEHSYVQTEDETFADGKAYYTKSGSTYTQATVTAGEALPTVYYVHSKVIFEGMVRNVTYRCNTIIDCPMEFILPDIEDETHGCWFEIRCQHAGEYSMTLVPPSDDVKIATEHTQKEKEGINMINLHYTVVNGTKVWRFLNTHSTIPA